MAADKKRLKGQIAATFYLIKKEYNGIRHNKLTVLTENGKPY